MENVKTYVHIQSKINLYLFIPSKQNPFTMSEFKTNWTKEDFIVYTLIYCANADFVEEKLEIDFITSKINTSNIENLKAEFNKDNDYISIQKISGYIKDNNYTEEDKQLLLEDIKSLFMSDGKYDNMEHNLMLGLKKIIR